MGLGLLRLVRPLWPGGTPGHPGDRRRVSRRGGGQGLAVNTLRLRHAALRYLHLLAGYPPPTATALVTTTFAGIKRAHRRPLGKKSALIDTALAAAIATIPTTLPGLRDRALLLVGFAAALRPSEIAGLTIDHLAHHPDGIELFLPWRKNDQDAEGTRLWLPQGQTLLCPVVALNAWLAAAEIIEGPLFRRIWRLPPPRRAKGARRPPDMGRFRIGLEPIDTDSIALVVKKWTGEAGFDGTAFAGHSLRRGAISTGVAQGVHIARLKQFSGHASFEKSRGIYRARRIAAKSSAEGRPVRVDESVVAER